MDDRQKEKIVARLTSGLTRIKLNDTPVYISHPRLVDSLEAQEIYEECLIDAELSGAFTEEQAISEMQSLGLWSEEEEEKMTKMPKDIEDLKVGLFKSDGQDKLHEGVRKKLKEVKSEFYSLVQKRSEITKNTASGLSEVLQTQYLLYTSIVDREGKYLYKGQDFWVEDLKLIDKIYSQYTSNFIPESSMREIARTDPWRSIWNASKSEGTLFGIPCTNLGRDQKALINWSRFYDSINESPDSPNDRVIKDDDMLDGWVIVQSRKREKDKFRRDIDEKTARHAGAGEIGVVVGSDRMARDVDELNSPMAKRKLDSIKSQTKNLMERGRDRSIDEHKLSAVKREIQMQAVQESRKGGK